MHTKSIAAGGRKGRVWTVTPRGPHRKSESIPLLKIIRDNLGLAEKGREARRIIASGAAEVDGTTCRDPNRGVGLMDTVCLPKMKKSYRIVPYKHGLTLKEITEKDSKIKLCRINHKTVISKGRLQLNLHDGTNMITDQKAKVNDTVVVALPSRKIKEIIPYETGNRAVIVRGRHRGEKGVINDVTPGTIARKSLTTMGDIHTLTDYIFVTGKDKPVIEV